jgi:hypothetical protein
MSSVADNLAGIRTRIDRACRRAGRDPATVHLVGVTKTVAVDRIREAVLAGAKILGENYIQEAGKKREGLADLAVAWHFIGHLQSNKARQAVAGFELIHSVDRPALARELDRQALKQGRRVSVLLQVNLGDQETKSGCAPEDLPALFRAIQELGGVEVRGLMALPPYLKDPEQLRPYFRHLRQLLDQLRQLAPAAGQLSELSMGMSHDFEVAVEEGATLVRIGTALFGARHRRP